MTAGSQTTDLVVVGSGVAGLSAAVEAARSGLRVTIVEAQQAIGGASAISGGGCCIVGTPVQEQLGIDDSVEHALVDWERVSGGLADLDWAERYLRASRTAVWDWCEQLGLTWQRMARRYPDNSVARWHRPVGGGGAVVAALRRALDPYPVSWRLGTRLVALTSGDEGLQATMLDGSGSEEVLQTRAIVLATGGFSNNAGLIDSALGGADLNGSSAASYLLGGGVDANGDGHVLLERLGAQFVNLSNVWFYPVGVPNHRFPGTRRGLVVRGILNDVWLNAAGLRFHDERDRGGRAAAQALRAQPGATAWGIQDADEIARALLLDDGYFGTTELTIPDRLDEFLRESPSVVRAASLDALADGIGLPLAAVRDAVAGYNAEVAAGATHDGTPLRPIARGPFFALRYELIAQKTFGGVLTDAECRVLDLAGTPIDGVFAAGELAGMAGGHINGAGALEGTMFGPCLYSGRIAGAAIGRSLVSLTTETTNAER
jgi:predicted oxidoreductase